MAEATTLKLPKPVSIRAAGVRATVETVQQAIDMIDTDLPREFAQLPRWTFARALLVEALHTNKSRDVRTAARQLQQALQNEGWAAPPGQKRKPPSAD